MINFIYYCYSSVTFLALISKSVESCPRLLAVVFKFASSHHDSHSGSELATLAMGAINEIMYRNCVPADFESFLLQLFRDTFQLLQVNNQPCQLRYLLQAAVNRAQLPMH